jgi:predicted butyrate kinase (DUF1464 family)
MDDNKGKVVARFIVRKDDMTSNPACKRRIIEESRRDREVFDPHTDSC